MSKEDSNGNNDAVFALSSKEQKKRQKKLDKSEEISFGRQSENNREIGDLEKDISKDMETS